MDERTIAHRRVLCVRSEWRPLQDEGIVVWVERRDTRVVRSKTESVQALWDAWSRGNVPELLGVLHPDVVVSTSAGGRELRGRAEVERRLERLVRDYKSLTVTLDAVEDAGDGVAIARGRVTGFGYDGETLDLPLTWVTEFEGALAVSARVFTDDAAARRYVASRGVR